jgi:hypothetical protein
MERNDPTELTERTDPSLAIERTEFREATDHREVIHPRYRTIVEHDLPCHENDFAAPFTSPDDSPAFHLSASPTAS